MSSPSNEGTGIHLIVRVICNNSLPPHSGKSFSYAARAHTSTNNTTFALVQGAHFVYQLVAKTEYVRVVPKSISTVFAVAKSKLTLCGSQRSNDDWMPVWEKHLMAASNKVLIPLQERYLTSILSD